MFNFEFINVEFKLQVTLEKLSKNGTENYLVGASSPVAKCRIYFCFFNDVHVDGNVTNVALLKKGAYRKCSKRWNFRKSANLICLI